MPPSFRTIGSGQDMARLSDLMWHTVKHAPVDETITADSAIARVRARRLARWGWIGGGFAVVVAIVGVNVVVPALTSDATPEPGVLALEPSPTVSPGPLSRYELLDSWWGKCETDPQITYSSGDTDLFSLDVDFTPGAVLDPGDTLDFTATLTARTDTSVLTDGIDAVILFDDHIVGTLMSDDIFQIQSLAQGETSTVEFSFPLVICGSTTELGPGDYELLVSQGYNPDVTGREALEGGTSTVAPRVTAEPIPFTISGDPSTNPLNEQGASALGDFATPALPENVLDPETAQRLLEPLMVENDWDMAPGTSRWIVPQFDYGDEISYGGYYYVEHFSPCDSSGLVDGVFPTVSAAADLFEETVTLPSSIELRYGWVVRDDPILEVTLRNTSGLYIPGGGFPSYTSIYLFRDGVLAGWGNASDLNAYANLEAESPPISLADMDPALYYGLIEPDASFASRIIWRELHPCSTTAEFSSLPPGTYTVMTSREFPLGMIGGGGAYFQLQLWTSQGTIEIID